MPNPDNISVHGAAAISRRTFLAASGAGALLGSAGCGRSNILESWQRGGSDQPFASPSSERIDLVSHVLNRLSFGPVPGEYERVRKLGASEEEAAAAYVEEQLLPEAIEDGDAERKVRRLESLQLPLGELFEMHDHVLLREMVHGTILRAVHSKRQLYEVMVQFWSDHFNIDPSKGDGKWLKAWDDREVIRRHALGAWKGKADSFVTKWMRRFGFEAGDQAKGPAKFPDLVRASALSPAMLWYLDGRENRKRNPDDKPNENYARELLELHTLGVHGGYSQKDVMEVARCLTGWTVRAVRRGPFRFHAGQVEFKPGLHDNGPKEVLGHQIPAGLGAQDLDRVLRIVSLHPSTARHLAAKLCQRFIRDDPPSGAVQTVAEAFLKSEGDIRETLRTLFQTAEFKENRGTKLKRPFHFVVSALRAARANLAAVPDRYEDGPIHSYLLRMGHVPFHYPTPDGYPEEATPWLGTLLWRWNFALALSENRLQGVQVRPEALERLAGGVGGLMAHLLGRQPNAEEIDCFKESGAGLALCLASPAFQWS